MDSWFIFNIVQHDPKKESLKSNNLYSELACTWDCSNSMLTYLNIVTHHHYQTTTFTSNAYHGPTQMRWLCSLDWWYIIIFSLRVPHNNCQPTEGHSTCIFYDAPNFHNGILKSLVGHCLSNTPKIHCTCLTPGWHQTDIIDKSPTTAHWCPPSLITDWNQIIRECTTPQHLVTGR